MPRLAAFLWSYRRALGLALLVGGLCSLVGALALFLMAPAERIATLPFRLLFEGAAQNRYPNGTLFSPMEIVAPSVLREVFRANHLEQFGAYEAFEQSVFVLGANKDVERLTEEYQARLSDVRLTPVYRARIEEELRTRRAAMIDPVFSVNIRSGVGPTAVPLQQTEKILSDTLATWAEHVHNRKGATRYNIPILSKDILDRSLIEREDYFIATDVLRAKTYRVMGTIETLARLPGGQSIRIGDQKLSLADIRSNLEDTIRFRLVPLLDFIRTQGITKNPAALRLYANNQLFQLRLEREQSLNLVTSLQRALRSYTAERPNAPRPQIGGRADEKVDAAPTTPSMDQSFLDRLVALGTAADDQEYRRTLTDRIIEAGARSGDLQREEAFYQDLAMNLRTMGGRSDESPATVALIEARTTQAFDEVSQAASHVSAVYDQLSAQNLRTSTPLYATTEPYTFSTRRAVSSSTAGLLVVVLFMLMLVSTLAGCTVHHRLTRRRTTA